MLEATLIATLIYLLVSLAVGLLMYFTLNGGSPQRTMRKVHHASTLVTDIGTVARKYFTLVLSVLLPVVVLVNWRIGLSCLFAALSIAFVRHGFVQLMDNHAALAKHWLAGHKMSADKLNYVSLLLPSSSPLPRPPHSHRVCPLAGHHHTLHHHVHVLSSNARSAAEQR